MFNKVLSLDQTFLENVKGKMRESWICPRCKRVNAPWTPYCDCNKNGTSADSNFDNGYKNE